jgi:hypothetical protein
MGVRVGVGGSGEHQGADHPAAAPERDDQAGAKRRLDAGLVGIRVGEAHVGPEVVDPHRLAGERLADRPVGPHVAAGRAEGRRVVLLVEDQGGGRVLGEHGEGAAVVVQVVDDEPVVRDEPLDRRRELLEEALRVELLPHRTAERGQRGDQVVERGRILHRAYDDTPGPDRGRLALRW